MSRLDRLESKVAALWPPLKKLDLLDKYDDSVVTGVVNGTVAADSLDWDTTPYPNGAGGRNILGQSCNNQTGLLVKPGDFRTYFAGGGSIGAPFQYLGGPWSDYKLYVPELLRPFQAIRSSFGLASEQHAMSYRFSDTIRVHRIDAHITLRPDFSLTVAERWQPFANGDYGGALTTKPGKIMFMWIEYLDWKNLATVYRNSPTAGSIQTQGAARTRDGDLPSMWIPSYFNLFKNLRETALIVEASDRDPGWGFSYVPDALQSDEDWDRLVWNSPINGDLPPEEFGTDSDITTNPRFKVHKVVRHVATMGHKHTYLQPVSNNEPVPAQFFNPADPTLATLNITYEYGPGGIRIKPVTLDLSLHFGNDGTVVDYYERPVSTTLGGSTGTPQHSAYGLAKRDLRLICVSNRSPAFWGFDQLTPTKTVADNGQGMTASIHFRG